MTRTGLKLFFAGALCLASAAADAAGPADKSKTNAKATSVKVWLLKQQGIFVGQYDVYVSDQGLRAVGVRSHTVIVSRPPAWDVVAFNTNAKTMWSGKLNEFRPTQGTQRLLISVGGSPNLTAITFPRSANGTLSGVKTTRFFTDSAWTTAQTALYRKTLISKIYPKTANYVTTGEVTNCRQPISLLERLYSTPVQHLIPLEYTYVQFNGNNKIILTTASAKPSDAPRDWLTVPPGLRRVASMEEVSMDSTSQEGMNQMLDNIRP